MGVVDWAKAMRRAAVDSMLPQRFVFHHIPKCGGTSVGRALRRRYILSQATVSPESSFRAFALFSGRDDRERMLVDVLDLREQMLLFLMFEDVRGIALHVRFSEKAYEHFRNRYKFVTVLRDPVERFVSHYFWSRGKTHAHARIEDELDAFLGTDRARRLGATMVEYLCGLPKDVPTDSAEAIDAAVANLERFDIVGDIGDVEDIQTRFRKVLGVRVSIGHENKGRRQPDRTTTALEDAAVRSRVEALCAPDIALYARFRAGRA